MGRIPLGCWNPRAKRYYSRIGPPKSAGGKPSAVPLLNEDGTPVAKGDTAGRMAAVARIMKGRAKVQERGTPGWTTARLCSEYARWQEARGAAKRTVEDHVKHLTRFCKFRGKGRVPYGDRPASTITPEDVWALQDAHEGSLRLVIHSILACWRWAARPIRGREPARLLVVNPLQGLERPPAGSRTDCEINWHVARRILRVARGEAHKGCPGDRHPQLTRIRRRLRILCLHLIAATGARPHEAVALRWDEIDWATGIVAIGGERDKRRRPGRRPRQARRFVVSKGLLAALRVVRAMPGANEQWCFAVPGRESEPLMASWHHWLEKWLRPLTIRRISGLRKDWTPYWFRHAAINEAIRAGEPIDIIGDQFGNSIDAMRSYQQAADKVRRRVAESVQSYRRKNNPRAIADGRKIRE